MARRRRTLPPLTRPQKIAFIAGPLVLAPIIVIGIIVENRTASISTPSASSTPTSPLVPPPPSPQQPNRSPAPAPADTEQPDSPTNLTFGQTARFTSTAGSNKIPLEFTVSAPTPFTPSKDALYFDAANSVGGEGTRQANNVYFTLTIRNISATQAYDLDFVFSHLHNTGDDDQISSVDDGDIEGTKSLEEIKPGKSITIKDGYSVKSASSIQYQLAVDGLAGKSFYFKD